MKPAYQKQGTFFNRCLEKQNRTTNIRGKRDFTVKVEKSGLSIKQCSQGFRILQLLKNLGIGELSVDVKYDDRYI